MPENYYIYCNNCCLRRRVNKVYHFRETGEPFVYDIDNMPVSLKALKEVSKVDWWVMKNYKPKEH